MSSTRYYVTERLTANRASVRTRVHHVIIQRGKRMISTNYYIIHKTGRRLKVSCIGFCHDEKLRKAMLLAVAKIEQGRTQDYKIETEKAIEHPDPVGRKGTLADYKEFTL